MTSKQSSKRSPSKSPKKPAAQQKREPKTKALPPALPGSAKKRSGAKAASTSTEEREADGAGHGSPTAPTELSPDVLEFIHAIDAYKRQNRRPFPSWSEVFGIVKSLGYGKSA